MAEDQSLNEAIYAYLLARGIRLSRVEAGIIREMAGILRRLQDELVASLNEVDWSGDISRNVARLATLRRAVDSIIGDAYGAMDERLVARMEELVQNESGWFIDTVNGRIGGDLFSMDINERLLRQLATRTLVEGAPSADWWSQQSDNLVIRFIREMQQGILQGEGTPELARRIRGTQAEGYEDGIMALTARQATALVRSSVQAVTEATRREIYQANSDVLLGVRSVAVLDLRTTPVCRAYDQQTWDLEGNPILGTTLPYFPPPRHWNCRSVLVPLVKSWEQLAEENGGSTRIGRIVDQMGGRTRASMDGQVPQTMTYDEWLRQHNAVDPEGVRNMLGPTRYELWLRGNIRMQDLINSNGDPLRIDQL